MAVTPPRTRPPQGTPFRRAGSWARWGLLVPAGALAAAAAALTAASTRATYRDADIGWWSPWLAKGAALAGLTAAASVTVTVTAAGIAYATERRRHSLTGAILVATAAVSTASLLLVPGGPYPRLPAEPAPQAGANTPSVTVFTANLLKDNTDAGRGIANEIAQAHPDLVILEETSPETLTNLAVVLARYPYQVTADDDPSIPGSGLAVYSRTTLTGTRINRDQQRPIIATSTRLQGVLTTVIAFHPSTPIDEPLTRDWVDAFATLSGLIPPDRHVIVAGDFNATVAHSPFRNLTARHGLTDVTNSAPTWPQNGYAIPLVGSDAVHVSSPFPPLLGLDHVLTRGFRTVSARLGVGTGSDHRPVIAELTAAP